MSECEQPPNGKLTVGKRKIRTEFVNRGRLPASAEVFSLRPQAQPETFAEKMQRGARERFTETLAVTPDIAAMLLAVNGPAGGHNRNISQAQVEKHIRRLTSGKFILTHQGVAVSLTGRLLDGQHRLTAVCRSGIAAQMQVTFGCEPEEFAFIDSGKARTAGDLLSIDGAGGSSNATAAVIALVHVLTVGGDYPDNQTVLSWYQAQSDHRLDEAVDWGGKIGRAKVTNCAAAGAAYWLIRNRTAHVDKLEPFFKQLQTGLGTDRFTGALRDQLKLGGDLSRGNGQTTSVRRIAAIINTWNHQFRPRRSGGQASPVTAWEKLPTNKVPEAI